MLTSMSTAKNVSAKIALKLPTAKVFSAKLL